MSSFLLFQNGQPIEIQYTQLKTGNEYRYVIKAGEVGAVIRATDINTWEITGKSDLDIELVQRIGTNILKLENNWCMTDYDFKILSQQEQLEALAFHAVRIGERKDQKIRYALYQLDGFYIELLYDVADDELKEIRSFSAITFLEPYLLSIDITSVKNAS